MEVSEEILAKRGAEVEALYNLAKTLNTGLDRRSLALLMELMEAGVNPESLVDVVEEFRRGSNTGEKR